MTRHPVHKAPTPRRLANWLRPGHAGGQAGEESRPAADGTNVRLRDGARVLIRPVRSTDASLIAEGFARLSEQSRRMRFLGKKDELTAAELHYYANVDHHDHEALGALDPDSGCGVGAVQTGRNFGTLEHEIALVRPDEYNLEWWFRGVEEASVFTWR
ncbi:MAG TPA: hypothetical protein VFQ68_18620 [Streptosporangiaceae bacterium]|nr:hypothetical protein [Streptosporangiaceae bacterium]